MIFSTQTEQDPAFKDNIEQTEYIGKCDLRIITTHGSCTRAEINAKTLKELKTHFNLQTSSYNVEALLFCKEQFTKQAQNKLKEILLNFAKKSFTLMEIKIAENFFDKQTQETLNALLERNRQFRVRILKIACFSPLIGTLVSASILGSLFPTLLASLIVTGYVYWDLNNDFKTTPIFITRNEMFNIRVTVVLIFSVIHSLVWTGPVGSLISLFTGASGFLINYYRDHYIKEAITKYNVTDFKFNNDEEDSFRNGLIAQKSFIPVFCWKRSTWKNPDAYYAGIYEIEPENKNKLR